MTLQYAIDFQTIINMSEPTSDGPKISEDQLLNYVLEALHNGNIKDTYPTLKSSFPDYEPENLFRTLVLQQAWVLVCDTKFDEASKLLEELGENPGDQFYEMWRQTTRNRIRTLLYDYLNKKSLLSPQDEEHFQILTKITNRYPNTSFLSAQKHNKSPAMKIIIETAKLPEWQDIIDLSHDFNENKSMIFPELFKVPDEIPVDSPRYFLGNIALIESQPPDVLLLFKQEGSELEKLWLMHCEHKIIEMAAAFKDELDKNKNNPNPKLNCLQFVNLYYKQMNQYEQETLLDTLCISGFFCNAELANFELLLIRICKNKALFDQAWWSHSTLNFVDFFKQFAKYCGERNLYMPFEMFVISHPKTKEIDMSDFEHPMIRFIWDLWIKRDPSAATLSNMQYLAKSNSTDPVELWKSLPSNSLAPLASYVWNKDPTKFLPNSPEVEALSERLKPDYPLLASLVKGEIPHPQPTIKHSHESKWRSPIFTSKYDLELHDLVASHFEQFDFSKVFTDYYGKTPGQPPFPHFDHPKLITTPSEPPYVHYVKALLPVSAFQQATEDGYTKEQFTDLCFDVTKEALTNRQIRLAALTFIELTDLKFKSDLSVDFKLVISIFDYLKDQPNISIGKDGQPDQDDMSISSGSSYENISLSSNIQSSQSQGSIQSVNSKESFSQDKNLDLGQNQGELSPINQIKSELAKVFKTKDQTSAKILQKKLNPKDIDSFLLSALLGVRCNLPLDYAAISHFASLERPAELLLYIDRAAEIGANYSNDKIEEIIRDEMPENPLKAHLLFHLTQVLPEPPAANSPGPNEGEVQPALVVFRALRKKDCSPHVALLQEALSRNEQLYALLATSVEGSDTMLCALITLFTMTPENNDRKTFDVMNPPPRDEMRKILIQTVQNLLLDKKSAELLKALELFSEDSVVTNITRLYRAIEGFSFRKAELALEKINEFLNTEGQDGNEVKNDQLLGDVNINVVLQSFLTLQDSLAKLCVAKSQVHLFRYLELLQNTKPSPFLEQRVKLSKVISSYENFRRAIIKTDLLGEFDKIVSDLVLNHSLALGQAAAKCLDISSAEATQEYLRFQFSAATSPADVLTIHNKIASTVKDANYLFYVGLFASLLPYAQPSYAVDLLKYARKNIIIDDNNKEIVKQLDALLLYLKICQENSIEVKQSAGSSSSVIPTIFEILKVLFPTIESDQIPSQIKVNITSSQMYSIGDITTFLDEPINVAIDYCLDQCKVDDARLICAWRNKNPLSIVLLEAIQKAFTNDEASLTPDEKSSLSKYGTTSNMQKLLDTIAEDAENGKRFKLISLQYKAATMLNWPTTEILNKKTEDYLKSSLPMMTDQWPLVKSLISLGKLSAVSTAECLVESFVSAVTGKSQPKGPNALSINEYGQSFTDFVNLCETPSFVGERLFESAKNLQKNGNQSATSNSLQIIVNIILHASLFTSDIDECADMLDSILDQLISENQTDLIIEAVSVFRDPSLLPRYFQYIISQNKLDALQHGKLSNNVGRVIMNCARHVQNFVPENYFDITLNYKLYRDHAELQMECGTRLLEGNPDKPQLQEASRHFLLALSYFLHEKCYSLSMECLKKLSLISLQLEISDPPVLHLNKDQAINLMCTKEFPFALTVAVAYDTDTEENWARAIFEQAIKKPGEDFLTPYQYFRPITAALCDGVVKYFKDEMQKGENSDAKKKVEMNGMTERMKQFLYNIPNLVERYRVAKELDFQDQIDTMKEVNPVVCEWCEKVLLNE